MYKRYQGNSGLVRRVEEPAPPPPGAAPPPPPRGFPPPGRAPAPPPRAPGLFARLETLLPGLRAGLETEDLLLGLILYLLYRESGEMEFLAALGALLFLE